MKYVITILMLMFMFIFISYACKDLQEDYRFLKGKEKSKRNTYGNYAGIHVNNMYYKNK